MSIEDREYRPFPNEERPLVRQAEHVVHGAKRGQNDRAGPEVARTAGQRLDDRIEQQAGGEAVRDVVGEGHEGQGGERRHVAPGDATSVLTYDVSGGTVNVYAWRNTTGTDPTLVASTGTETFSYQVVGY